MRNGMFFFVFVFYFILLFILCSSLILNITPDLGKHILLLTVNLFNRERSVLTIQRETKSICKTHYY